MGSHLIQERDALRWVGEGPSFLDSEIVKFAQRLNPAVHRGRSVALGFLKKGTVGMDVSDLQIERRTRSAILLLAPPQEGPQVSQVVHHCGWREG